MLIDVAKTFSPYPSGRTEADGQFNGQAFRNNVLVPAIRQIIESGDQGQQIIIDIDGVRTFGSSFLDEAFGGLLRSDSFSKSSLRQMIIVHCTKKHLLFFKDSIESYLN